MLAWARARALRPDVLVMDIRMPVMDGIAERAKSSPRGADSSTCFTTYDLDEYVYEALRAVAAGFMLKASPPDRLVDAIGVVAGGEALLAPSLTQRLIAEYVQRPPPSTDIPSGLRELTERERELLVLVARGLSNEDIAAALYQPRNGHATSVRPAVS